MSDQPKLLSFEFIAFCLVIVAAFCNVSVFYSFYHYLGAIDIPLAWRGFLVGLEPMTAFVLRLFVLPWLHVRNAYSVTMASLVLLILASFSYLWATSVPALIVLRVFHGAVFVLLTSSAISLIVNFIPKEKSGQGFSTLSVATMIPYAIIPPALEVLLPYFGNEARIYAAVSVFSLVALFLLAALHKRVARALSGMDGVLQHRPTLSELRDNFRTAAVVLLLLSTLFVYLAHATFFYFMKDLTLQTGVGNVGLFFTICMATTISVRALGGLIFDRMNKERVLQAVLLVLILCVIMIPRAGVPAAFYVLAGGYGLSVGIILPLLNALLFSASPPLLRGLNTNLTLFTADAGYFLVPYVGGALIACGAGFSVLFYITAGFVVLALALMTVLASRQKIQEER